MHKVVAAFPFPNYKETHLLKWNTALCAQGFEPSSLAKWCTKMQGQGDVVVAGLVRLGWLWYTADTKAH